MNSINELSNELALAFLVDKKYAGKINSSDILTLIGKVSEFLQPLAAKENRDEKLSGLEKTAHFGNH